MRSARDVDDKGKLPNWERPRPTDERAATVFNPALDQSDEGREILSGSEYQGSELLSEENHSVSKGDLN